MSVGRKARCGLSFRCAPPPPEPARWAPITIGILGLVAWGAVLLAIHTIAKVPS